MRKYLKIFKESFYLDEYVCHSYTKVVYDICVNLQVIFSILSCKMITSIIIIIIVQSAFGPLLNI